MIAFLVLPFLFSIVTISIALGVLLLAWRMSCFDSQVSETMRPKMAPQSHQN